MKRFRQHLPQMLFLILAVLIMILEISSDGGMHDRRSIAASHLCSQSADSEIIAPTMILVPATFQRVFLTNLSRISEGLNSFHPIAAVSDRGGRIYILDAWSHSIAILDSGGSMIDSLATGADGLQIGQPMDLSVDSTGNLLIPDLPASRVLIVNPLTRTSSSFSCPFPMYALPGPNGSIYVHSMGDSCAVRQLDRQGRELLSFGVRYSSANILGRAQQDMDLALNEFLLARDLDNNVFTCQPTLYEIHKFSADGILAIRFGLKDPICDTLLERMNLVRGPELAAAEGSCLPYQGYAEFAIHKVAIDDNDNLWLSHRANRLDIFRTDGTYRGSIDLSQTTPTGEDRLILLTYVAKAKCFLFLTEPNRQILAVKVFPQWSQRR